MNSFKAALLLAMVMLYGCATTNQPASQQGYVNPSYSPSVTNEGYMYRSPPPAAIQATGLSGRR
ncbi:MAG: hypothetical protein H0W64_09470 [Gammaproteobacteria bacterium]|nr:hypothetical protein [Gammaproteobacteria bacterium]